MTDPEVEEIVRSVLRTDDPGGVPESLRQRVRAVGTSAAPILWRPRSPFALIGTTAVLIVALLSAALLREGTSLIPAQTPGGASVASTSSPGTVVQPSPGIKAVSGPWSSLSWSQGVSVLTETFDIAVWDGQLVAIGQVGDGNSAVIATAFSKDGVHWTQPVSSSAAVFGRTGPISLVTLADGLLAWGTSGEPTCVGVGPGSSCGAVPQGIWTSKDGVDWRAIGGSATFDDATILKVVDGFNGLVAIGSTAAATSALWFSTTGETWMRVGLSDPVFAHSGFDSLVSTSGGYVIGGSFGPEGTGSGGARSPAETTAAAWWSRDGVVWTRANVTGGAAMINIEAAGGSFVAVGSTADSKGGIAWSSSDGRAWNALKVSLDDPSPRDALPSYELTGDGSHVIAAGYDSQGIRAYWDTPDGVHWTAISAVGDVQSGPRMIVVPNGLVVLGSPSGQPPMVPVWFAEAR